MVCYHCPLAFIKGTQMKKLMLIALMLASMNCVAQESLTRTLPDGRTQVVVPVMERQCQLQDKVNLGNAALGAGVGYASGKVAGRMLGGRGSTGGLLGLAVGAMIGANTQNEQTCRYVDVLTGHKVITIQKNGKSNEVFIPYKKVLTTVQ